MKKLFIILYFFPFWGLGGLLAQSSVSVVPITANYSANPPTVTFEVSWPANTRDANHRSKVWVLVDYRRIQNNAYVGGWLRAGISTAHTPTANAGAVSLETGNTKGFWLQGTDGAFAATITVPVTVDLSGYASQFGWCGVASDRPPYAEEKSTHYALNGTLPFIIQTIPGDPGSTVSQTTPAYDNCIYGLTDATGCPGEWPVMPAITGFTTSATTICAGESVTLTATATNAQRYSFDDGANWVSSPSTVVTPLITTTYKLKATREKGGCTVTFPTQITITVNDPPTNLSLTADPDVICADEPATLTASSTGDASYSLTGNGSDWQAATTFVVTPAASTYYTLYVKSTAGCTATKADAATVTVNALPTITLTSANCAQTVTPGSAITQIKYNTTNATSATPSNLPPDVTGSWSSNVYTISGTPTSAGTYNYTVTTTNSNGCTNASATGTLTIQPAITYTGCNPSTLTLTGVGFASTVTYTRNGITISAYVTVSTCNKENYDGGFDPPFNADCRSNPGYDGDLFSWCMVAQHAEKLCPSGWRVPTYNDACKYAGLPDQCEYTAIELYPPTDGWQYTGLGGATDYMGHQGQRAYAWTSTPHTDYCAKYIEIDENGMAVDWGWKRGLGFSLRCVKDAQ